MSGRPWTPKYFQLPSFHTRVRHCEENEYRFHVRAWSACPKMPGPREELQEQWANPSDILSLLLLVGGDVVQKAIA